MSTATEVVKAKDLSMALDEISTEDDSMYISGGATVVALLNANLVNPAKLVSLKNVNELRGIKKIQPGIIVLMNIISKAIVIVIVYILNFSFPLYCY